MANSDKNILITPNIGSSSADPKIEFKGADSSTGPSTITASVYPTNNGTLSFDGSAGQLFSITNNLTSGSIFAVNDVSGIPSIDVNADGTISLGAYGGNIGVGTLSPSQKLQVQGSVRITGSLYDSNNTVGTAGSVLSSTGSGLNWVTPNSGAQGAVGAQGFQGVQGTVGAQGFQGVQGTVGAQGFQGVQGTVGAQGFQGVQGTIGVQGAQGRQGFQGVQGTVGAQGFQGVQGTVGAQGFQGVQGTVGAQGFQGVQGTIGVQGAQGRQGFQGVQGTVGAQGFQGVQGTVGAQGSQGVQGATGSGGSITDDTTTNATRYITFEDQTSGTINGLFVASTKLQFNPSSGTLSATVFTSLSDETQKTDIKPIVNAIDLVKQLQGVKYKWIDDHNQPSIGVIAQEIEKVLPEVVSTNDKGLKSVSYGNIVGVLIEAIKEQQVRIEELERKLDA
jgi:hypothetical protein